MYCWVRLLMILKMIWMNYFNYYLITNRMCYMYNHINCYEFAKDVGIILIFYNGFRSTPEKCRGITKAMLASTWQVHLSFINIFWTFKLEGYIFAFEWGNRWREFFFPSICCSHEGRRLWARLNWLFTKDSTESNLCRMYSYLYFNPNSISCYSRKRWG